MKLSDVVGNAGLSVYAEIALVIFLVSFVGIVIYAFSSGNKASFERARQLPLDDESGLLPFDDEPAPREVPR